MSDNTDPRTRILAGMGLKVWVLKVSIDCDEPQIDCIGVGVYVSEENAKDALYCELHEAWEGRFQELPPENLSRDALIDEFYRRMDLLYPSHSEAYNIFPVILK